MIEDIIIYSSSFMLIVTLLYLFKDKIRKYFEPTPTFGNPSVFYKKVKNGYVILVNSLYHNSDKKDLEDDINKVLLKRSDGRYVGGYSRVGNQLDWTSFTLDTFYDLIRYSDKREGSFILDFDKNISIEKLNNFFKNSLDYNIKDDFFPYQNRLSLYQEELNKNSIKIGFFTDNANSYYLILFPSSKERIIKKAISDIGFEYMKSIPTVVSNMSIKSKQKLAYI